MSDSARNTNQLVEMAVDALEPWPGLNPRKHFDSGAQAELEASVREKGVLQPLLVHVDGEQGPWVVAGERRLRAARAVNLRSVLCVVRTFSEEEALEAAIIENFQRENVSPVEEARGFQRWLEGTGRTQRELAEKIGCSQPYISNRLRLLDLPDELLAFIEDGTIAASWARDLLLPFASIPESKRELLYSGVATLVEEHFEDDSDNEFSASILREMVADAAEPLSTALAGYAQDSNRRYQIDAETHEECPCGAPAFDYGGWRGLSTRCFDDDWINAAKSQFFAEEDARRAKQEAASPENGGPDPEVVEEIVEQGVVTEEKLRETLGYQHYEILTTDAELRGWRLLDPMVLPDESLVVVRLERQDEEPEYELACIDREAWQEAEKEIAREKEEKAAERKAERAAEERKAMRGIDGLEPWMMAALVSKNVSTSVQIVAREHDIELDDRDLQDLDPSDLTLILQVLARRVRDNVLGWNDPIDAEVEEEITERCNQSAKFILAGLLEQHGLSLDSDPDLDETDSSEEEEATEHDDGGSKASAGPATGDVEEPDSDPTGTEEGPRYTVDKMGGVYRILDSETGEVRGTRPDEGGARAIAEKWSREEREEVTV